MNAPNQGYLITGKVGAAYGIKGWLKIQSYNTDNLSQILQYNPWYLAAGENWQAFQLAEGRPHGKGLVVKFVGIETPEEARLLTGREIAVQREQLTPLPKNEYYWADLEGLAVIDQRGHTLGIIRYLLATGSNDVLVIQDPQGKEHGIPYLPGSVVKEVDLEKGCLYVDWDLI